jgi:hypothetical protein
MFFSVLTVLSAQGRALFPHGHAADRKFRHPDLETKNQAVTLGSED